MSVRDRLYEKKFAYHIRLIKAAPDEPFCTFSCGHLYVGHRTKHLLAAARKVQTLQRFKI